MATVPSVYVTIEDKSFALPSLESGRSVYGVILSDRGPHNQVVELNSIDQFHRLFGKPDLERTGQAHYIIDKALQFTQRVFVTRPVLLDSETESNNAAIANCVIKYNNPDGSTQPYNGQLNFINETDATALGLPAIEATKVFTDAIGYDRFKPGDYIYSETDDETKAQKILTKTKNDPNYDEPNYYLTIDGSYDGTSTKDGGGLTARDVAGEPTDYEGSYEFYPAVEDIAGATFTFTQDSNIVVCADQASYDAINLEEWVFPSTQGSAVARQTIKKQENEVNGDLEIVIDEPFAGITSGAPEAAKTFIPVEIESNINVREDANIDPNDMDNIWYFVGEGAGSHYNNIFVTGSRNVGLEKMFTDDDGEPLYKYTFLDINIYRQNNDGTTTHLEGPWAVSLINKTDTGQIIRDLSTGKEMYLPTVINERSENIHVIESLGAEMLLTSDAAEALRLQVTTLFSSGTVTKLNTRGYEGFFLENGEDGIQYNTQGRLNMTGEINGVVLQAYNATLTSVDGSVEGITADASHYGWYVFNYVVCGGYNAEVQNGARQLCDVRADCLCLADTGAMYLTADDDLTARLEMVPWNTWNAMLFVQYREIFDPYTGKRFYISPVYHAIERHLYIDAISWIAEPVAGIEKGAISEPIKLAYRPVFVKIEDLLEKELNPVIVEPDGKYIISQFTTWKRLSVMKRAHAVKFVHFVKQNLPPLLKDILQHKATAYWIGQVSARINGFLSPYVETGSSERYAALSNFLAAVEFDEARSEIFVTLELRPIRAIEAIHVAIVVT